MNQEQAKAWLSLIQAVAEGKTIQTNMKCMENPNGKWIDFESLYPFSVKDAIYCEKNAQDFRIKPEPKKQCCRLALFQFDDRDFGDVKPKFVYAARVVSMEYCDDAAKQSNFIRWLTDRIEYELPEGDA